MAEWAKIGDAIKGLQEMPPKRNSENTMEQNLSDTQNAPPCDICGGVGWFGYEVVPGHPNFGKCYPCECTLREARRRRAEWVRRVCGLPVGLQGKFLRNFDPKRLKSGVLVARVVQEFAEQGGWVLLRGSYQVGKTHLAAAATNAVLDRNEHVVYTYTKALLDRLRQLIREPEGYIPLLDAIKECPYVVLDDLGVERHSEWVVEQLEDLFNWRADHELPLLVTTNLSDEDIRGFSPRIEARLRRLATVVVLQ